MSNVKLNWKFDKETKALSADGPGETWYKISDTDCLNWYCERRDSHRQMTYASWWQSKVPALEEALALCQRDAEEQKKRRFDHLTAEQEKARQEALKSFLETPCTARDDSPFANVGMYKGADGAWHKDQPPYSRETNEPEGAMPIGSPVCPLNSFDARVWAKEFMRINMDCVVGPIRHVTEEEMVGWFSNALMRGYDEHRWKIYPELKRLAEWAHTNLYGGEPAGWRALPDVSGVLTQLDNMLAGMGPKRPCDMNVQEFRAAAEEQVKKIVDAGKPPSKFPDTMDASVWASRCTAWFGAFKVPDLAEWFSAAIQRGYDKGLLDQAKNYENARAQSEDEADGSKSAKPKMDMSELSKKFDTLNEYVGKTIVELTARLRNVETLACNAASRVGQLWQKQTHEMREANRRIGKLEEKMKWSHK